MQVGEVLTGLVFARVTRPRAGLGDQAEASQLLVAGDVVDELNPLREELIPM